MTETGAPRVIDETVLEDIERDIRHATGIAEFQKAQAEKAAAEAEAAGRHAAAMPAVREFLAARMGMTLEDALREAEAELAEADAGVIEAAQRVERAKMRLRDLEGWRRIQAELIDRKRAERHPDDPDKAGDEE